MWRRMKAGGTQVNVRHLNKQNSIITMLSLFMMAHRIKLLACLFARWLAYLFCSILQHQLLHFNDNYCCSISWQLLGFLQEWHSKLSGRLLFEIQMFRIYKFHCTIFGIMYGFSSYQGDALKIPQETEIVSRWFFKNPIKISKSSIFLEYFFILSPQLLPWFHCTQSTLAGACISNLIEF